MRDILNKSLEMLIWIATAFYVILSCYTGALVIRNATETLTIVNGFLVIIFGVTMSFVFAGICFQIMDIRDFTKHTALSMKKASRR